MHGKITVTMKNGNKYIVRQISNGSWEYTHKSTQWQGNKSSAFLTLFSSVATDGGQEEIRGVIVEGSNTLPYIVITNLDMGVLITYAKPHNSGIIKESAHSMEEAFNKVKEVLV